MRAKTVSEVIVEQLAARGVEYVFGLPGTTCLGLVDAIRKQNEITGLYDAKMDRALVLALTGQVKLQYIGPGSFQEIDQDALFNSFCVFNKSSAFNRRSRATGDNRRLGC